MLPWVPVRQWVLTVPYRLRYQMAWNHGLSRAVLRVYTRVLFDVSPGDLGATLSASLVLLAAALLACVPPALRAMRVDPQAGLRME